MARVAYVVAGDAELAADAVQSAWEVAWRRLRTLRQPDRIRAWLVAIAANEARQSAPKSNRRRHLHRPIRPRDAGGGPEIVGRGGHRIDLVDLQDGLSGR